jgi:hypothetical protein
MDANMKSDLERWAGLAHRVLELPDAVPWPEPVNGSLLLDELEGVFTRFVVLPKWAAETLALWTLHTYAFPLRDVSTYLGIESPEKRCGKTTLLTVLSELANRPIVASNISSPALFRVIEETRPTLLIDEADTLLQGNDELRGILNSGYSRKTAFVVRVAGRVNRADAPERSDGAEKTGGAEKAGTRLSRYSCWCPKVMAAIGRLPDTLADRCIVLRMQRKTAGEDCERLRNLEATALRQQCARFVLDHGEAIATARPAAPAGLNDRAADIWEPLLALADLAGGAWPEKARQAAAGLTAVSQENSPIGSLLLDLKVMFVNGNCQKMHSWRMVEALNGLGDRPWTELRAGKEINELWLARQLRPYGIRPKMLWLERTTARGYEAEDFGEAFRRYIPRGEVEALKAASLEAAAHREAEAAAAAAAPAAAPVVDVVPVAAPEAAEEAKPAVAATALEEQEAKQHVAPQGE